MIEPKLGGWFQHYPRWVNDPEDAMRYILSEVNLRQDTLHLYGRDIPMPRKTAWVGDASYTYSGKRFDPEPWTPTLRALRQSLRVVEGIDFNTVLLNLYRDGKDSIAEHADDEPELGPSKDDVRVASISFGSERRFVLRSRASGEKWVFNLGAGDLFLMGGKLQQFYVHSVPKTAKPVGPRLNLTFRVVGRSGV